MMTIYEEFKSFQGLKIAIVGDLKHSRVAKSNMKLLKNLGASLYFVSPENYQEPIFSDYGEYVELDEIIEDLDVVMLLRINMSVMIPNIIMKLLERYGLIKKDEKMGESNYYASWSH